MKDMRDVAGLGKFASESVVYAFRQLRGDRFRTLLSLTGISIGIFTIVTTLTLVDSLEKSITDSFNEFGSDVAFIEQMPIEPDLNEDGAFRWWEYASRPQVSIDEYRYVRDNMPKDSKIAFAAHLSYPVSYGNTTSEAGEVIGLAGDWELEIREQVKEGRRFSERELSEGADVAILGNNAALRLFEKERKMLDGENTKMVGHKKEIIREEINRIEDTEESRKRNDLYNEEAENKSITIGGRRVSVIGILERSGDSMVSLTDVDEAVLIPAGCAEKIANLSTNRCTITTTAKSDNEQNIRQLIRQYRRLKPDEEDNFAVNRLSFVIEQMGGIFKLANILGWIIGGFSLLVGGFGIANIMFVAVSERVAEIGLQKALGARRSFIISGFLTESAVLTVMGGAIGIAFTSIIAASIPDGLIDITLSFENVIKGLAISIMTGIVAGVSPALSAAHLNPVDALRK